MSVLAHYRVGHGARALVLLHGLLGSARNLSGLARSLAARDPSLSVLSLDLTGHGASPPLPPGADLAALAHDVVDTAAALRLPDRLHIVGHSLGGRVALRVVDLNPAGVDAVTLLDIGPSRVARASQDVDALLDALLAAPDAAPSRQVFRAHFDAAGLSRALTEWLLLNLNADAGGVRWRIDRAAIAELHRRAVAEDLWPIVERERGYALRCIRGSRSPFVSDRDVGRLQAAGCPVFTVQDAGHFLHVDRPRELIDLLLSA